MTVGYQYQPLQQRWIGDIPMGRERAYGSMGSSWDADPALSGLGRGLRGNPMTPMLSGLGEAPPWGASPYGGGQSFPTPGGRSFDGLGQAAPSGTTLTLNVRPLTASEENMAAALGGIGLAAGSHALGATIGAIAAPKGQRGRTAAKGASVAGLVTSLIGLAGTALSPSTLPPAPGHGTDDPVVLQATFTSARRTALKAGAVSLGVSVLTLGVGYLMGAWK